MKRALLASILLTIGCSTSETPGRTLSDSGLRVGEDASPTPIDGGFIPTDTGANTSDSGVNGNPDAVVPSDGGPPNGQDAGVAMLEIVPGSHIETSMGRIHVMSDTLAMVRSRLGPGTRGMAMNSRSVEYTVDGGTITVWYANTGLDANPLTRIDDNDTVLWVAVTGNFPGMTPMGIGIGSLKGAVESVHGVAPRSGTLMDGTIDSYFSSGFLVAYNNNREVRTFTVCRRYIKEPDGQLDLPNGEIRWANERLESGGALGGGTSDRRVRALLGEPDARGPADVGRVTLDVLSYGFIGVEVFTLTSGPGDGDTLFTTVHAPFYGVTSGGNSMGALGDSRTAFESHLAALDFGSGSVASSNANVICYQHRRSGRWVGATYSADAPNAVTSILVGFPSAGCE